MAKIKNKKNLYYLVLVLLLIGVVVFAWPASTPPADKNSSQTKTNDNVSAQTGATANLFDRNQYSVNEASSLWVVVNKGRILPSGYAPSPLVAPDIHLRYGSSRSDMRLRADAAGALAKMFASAQAAGFNLMLASGYRSYSEQVSTYNYYVSIDGAARADTYSARPGHSEHQTGLAADVAAVSGKCLLDQCFGDMPEGKWLAANAYKYGFIIRYPKNGDNLTGYEYEPWHVRYVGTDLSAQLYASGQTLEQFFGLPIYQSYPSTNYELK